MRRTAAGLVVIAALVPALAASAAPDARTSAVPKKCPGQKPKDPLLEVVKLPAGNREPVPVATAFKPGQDYTVRICGTSNIHNAPTAGSTSVEDAFHYVSCTQPNGGRCPGTESWPLSTTGVQASDRRDPSQFYRGSIAYFAKGGGENPAYRTDHSYTLHLDDLGPDLVLRNAACCPGTYTLDGGYRVEIYGAPPKGFAARFSIDQRGEPAPPTAPELAGTETLGEGFVYFSSVPPAGTKVKGKPVGIVFHLDEFLDPATFASTSKELAVRLTTARYAKTKKARVLSLYGDLISVSGDGNTHDGTNGDTLVIAVVDGHDDEDDALKVTCPSCSGETIFERHAYVHGPKNSLKVRITPVKKL